MKFFITGVRFAPSYVLWINFMAIIMQNVRKKRHEIFFQNTTKIQNKMLIELYIDFNSAIER